MRELKLRMTELRDRIFENRGVLSEEFLKKYTLKSLEDVGKDLVEFANWDMVTRVASVALEMYNGALNQCMLSLHCESDSKRIDTGTVFGDDYKGGADHQIRIGRIELQKFCFRGSLVSNWLGPQEFPHSVQRPATTQPGVWRDMEQQPWSGLNHGLD